MFFWILIRPEMRADSYKNESCPIMRVPSISDTPNREKNVIGFEISIVIRGHGASAAPVSQIEKTTMRAKAVTMPGPKPSSAPRETKRDRTRSRLTQAALRLMAERGISGTSVSEIAAEAELANGTFYLYFKDKAESSPPSARP